MRLRPNSRHGCAAALAVVATVFMAQGGSSQGLSGPLQKRAVEIEAAARAQAESARVAGAVQEPGLPNLANTRAGQTRKSVVTGVTPAGSSSTTPRVAARSGQRAIVTRYDYATGVTTRTTVDLDTGRTLHVRKDVNYPTPLAEEETQQALALARRAVAGIDTIVRSATPQTLDVSYMVPLNSDPSSPRYGHRMVVLWVEKPTRSEKVLVDLSTEEVVPHH